MASKMVHGEPKRDSISIRLYEPADVDEIVVAVQESINDLLPWMPWCSGGYSVVDATRWVRLTREAHTTGAMYDFAILDSDGRYAGGCGLNQINPENRVANLGYWVRSSAAGGGIAPAAVKLLVAWAFANTPLNRLEIVVADANVRSRRVAEKSGARFDALLRKRLMVDGRPSDAALYSLVRPD